MSDIDRLTKQLREPGVWPLIGDLGADAANALEGLQAESDQMKLRFGRISGKLFHAESQALADNRRMQELESENRRLKADLFDEERKRRVDEP